MEVSIKELLQNRDDLLEYGGTICMDKLPVLHIQLIDKMKGGRFLSSRKFREQFVFYCNYAIASNETLTITKRGKPYLSVAPDPAGAEVYRDTLFM